MDPDRPLTDEEARCVLAARQKVHLLYEGVQTPHRSCGIAMAETFGLPTPSYQSLRRGGLTGRGECGVVAGGRMVLGEILGDPDPTGAPTPELLEAVSFYESRWPEAVRRGRSSSMICNDLTGQFDAFRSPERHGFCTSLATEVATVVAETLLRSGVRIEITPIAGVDDFDPAHPVDPAP